MLEEVMSYGVAYHPFTLPAGARMPERIADSHPCIAPHFVVVGRVVWQLEWERPHGHGACWEPVTKASSTWAIMKSCSRSVLGQVVNGTERPKNSRH